MSMGLCITIYRQSYITCYTACMNDKPDVVDKPKAFKAVQFRTPDHETLNERMSAWAEDKRKSRSIPNYVMVASDFYEVYKDRV